MTGTKLKKNPLKVYFHTVSEYAKVQSEHCLCASKYNNASHRGGNMILQNIPEVWFFANKTQMASQYSSNWRAN